MDYFFTSLLPDLPSIYYASVIVVPRQIINSALKKNAFKNVYGFWHAVFEKHPAL